MIFSFINHVGASSSDTHQVSTGAVDFTSANLIVAAVASIDAQAQTIFDSLGNTYSTVSAQDNGGVGGLERVQFFYVVNPTVGAAMTFSTNFLNSTYPSICVAAFSGVKSSGSLDQLNGANGIGVSSLAPGAITPSANNSLLLAACCFDSVISPITAVGGGFSFTDNLPGAANVAFGGALAYLIQTTAGSANPTFTGSGSSNMVAQILSFLPDTPPSGAGGGSNICIVSWE